MTYVVNSLDPTQPTDDKGAMQGAEEIRGLKSRINAIIAGANKNTQVRQTVLMGSSDANGVPSAVVLSAGLNCDLNPIVITAAASFDINGANDAVAQLASDGTDFFSNLQASNKSFLTGIVGSGSGFLGHQLIPPQYGYTFDRTKGAILNFEGVDASTSIIDDFGNTWTTAGNAQIDTAQFKFGTSSLLLDGTGDYVESTEITLLGEGSWESSLWFRINALPGAAARSYLLHASNAANFGATLNLFNNAGTTKLELSLSSNGTSFDITSATVGTNTVWALNQWNKVRLVFDALAGTYRIYLSLNGAIETQDLSVSSTLLISILTKFRIGTDGAGASGFNGWIDAVRFIQCATATAIETPAVVAPNITNYTTHFFSLAAVGTLSAMQMYQVITASIVAGTNPTMEAVALTFIGEADTGVAASSAVRTYAYNGQYVSALIALPAVATAASATHNIGVTPRKFTVELVCVTTDAGYNPGDCVRNWDENNGGVICPATFGANKYTIFTVRGTTDTRVVHKTTGVNTAITATRWKYRFFADRGW